MPPRDWDKERREARLRAHGGEPATEGGLPLLPRFGNLRDAAKLPRGRRERRAFSPHVAQQPAPLEFTATVEDDSIVVRFEPKRNRFYRVGLMASDNSKLHDDELPLGVREARLSYLRWERSPFTVRLAELEPAQRIRGRLKRSKEHLRRSRLIAEGKLIVSKDGHVAEPKRRRRK